MNHNVYIHHPSVGIVVCVVVGTCVGRSSPSYLVTSHMANVPSQGTPLVYLPAVVSIYLPSTVLLQISWILKCGTVRNIHSRIFRKNEAFYHPDLFVPTSQFPDPGVLQCTMFTRCVHS